MALDGLVIHSIVNELSSKLLNGKIDKIQQPESDEIVLHIRNNKENYKLILSANASIPRVYLADDYKKENPLKAPMFCMLFRKHIQGGIITEISQVDFERIIKISVESFDELKEKTTKNIYVEIMGRHSNIILTNESSNTIIDSAKRIPISVSRVRQILPAMTYSYPPTQDKLNPLNISKEEFLNEIKNSNDEIFKTIYSKFLGISPIIAKEICFRANIPSNKCASEVDILALYDEFFKLFNDIKNNSYSPCIVIDEKTDKVIDFSCVNLTVYNDLSFIKNESI
jgi:predicted ribosome quality control (RQC) complex YloA/Tae2 family protein